MADFFDATKFQRWAEVTFAVGNPPARGRTLDDKIIGEGHDYFDRLVAAAEGQGWSLLGMQMRDRALDAPDERWAPIIERFEHVKQAYERVTAMFADEVPPDSDDYSDEEWEEIGSAFMSLESEVTDFEEWFHDLRRER